MKVAFEVNWSVALRWVIGVVLIWAALGKLGNLEEFYTSLLAYQLPLPAVMIKMVAIVLPWLEFLCGSLLLANLRTRTALGWALALFVVFTLCTGQAWVRGLHIACGCLDLRPFGVSPGSSTDDFLESVGFAFVRGIALAVAAYFLLKQVEKTSAESIAT